MEYLCLQECSRAAWLPQSEGNSRCAGPCAPLVSRPPRIKLYYAVIIFYLFLMWLYVHCVVPRNQLLGERLRERLRITKQPARVHGTSVSITSYVLLSDL